MSKIQDYALYITSAQKSNYTALDGNSRLNVMKVFYKENNLSLPASVTVKESKKGSYLTKDEKIAIQNEYIKELQSSGKVSEQTANNFAAVNNPEEIATFSETLPFGEAVKTFGSAIVAAKMKDALNVSLLEKFNKIRKFDVPASVAISEIPELIKELQAIYENNSK